MKISAGAIYKTLLCLSFLFVASIFLEPGQVSAQQLFLNEILASNGWGITDEDGDNEDWIELYYAGDQPLNLEGFGLSDDYDRPFRWEFPDLTIQPGEFLLVWASGKDRSDPEDELHTNFSIASAGEEVLLTTPNGERIDELEPTEIPTDISLGRYPDGTGDWYFYDHPTPGEPNGDDGYRDILDPIEFSHTGGFYDTPFELTLSHPDPDVTIYYTLDGSEPDPEKVGGQTYSYMDRYRPSGDLQERSYETLIYEPGSTLTIDDRSDEPNYLSRKQTTYESNEHPYYFPDDPIFKGTAVRAVAVKNGYSSPKPDTHTYFVTDQPEERYTLPVISLSIQEDYLFDYETGMYVPGKIYDDVNPMYNSHHAVANYNQRGIEWERPASMEIFEPGVTERVFNQDLGVRLHGGSSRSFPIKSFRLYARNQYGDNRFYHQMIPDNPYNEYNRLILRNSGNDWDNMMIRDPMIQNMVGHMNFDTQAYQPYIVFINGEYWGILSMRERYDKHYLERVHGADPENIDLLSGSSTIKEGDDLHYTQMWNYMEENDIAQDHHYEDIQTRMDTDNFIDYQIAQIFVGNTDWPGNNIDYWRYRTDSYNPDAPGQLDGRWRWLLFDTDFGFSRFGEGAHHNTLEFAAYPDGDSWPNPSWSTFIFRSLLENERFRNDFITRYLDQLNSGFRTDWIVRVIREMTDRIQPEIAEHHERWSRPWGGLSDWEGRIEANLVNYAEQRPGYARQHLFDFFEIENEHDITVDISNPAEGFVHVNTIAISGETPGIGPEPYPWTGTYFEGIPVTLKAEPLPGYRFSHWEGIDAESHLTEFSHNLTSPLSVTAVFEEDPNANLFPVAHRLSDSSYQFDEWPADAEAGSYPDNMAFVYMDERDPELTAQVAGFTDGVYDLDSRTRINGLGQDGFAFINTGNEDGNPGYPGTTLGGAILALDTQEMKNISVHWQGSTIRPNSRVYNLQLQYRIGNEGEFQDLLTEDGDPVEYERNDEEGHSEWIGPVTLPQEAENKAYVQLLWRYYYTGERLDEESGQRSKMAVTSISVDGETAIDIEPGTELPREVQLDQNYPNPFNPVTVIGYQLPVQSDVRLEIFDMLGRRVAVLMDGPVQSGHHQATFDASGLSSGVYVYRLTAGDDVQTRQMVLVK
ncbi:T9SS C-terminal target domain-containing protein [Rhodohalobacter sp. SW132]|uniref:CotH kinase family protein n=1 Tax=Rhodohalobacter sp. SW132 TaxID=2293433 RepID=UPI000E27158E|nr:CotH kinase family protein [Rhodohalobacter sp. SW132]REL38128.1 T9SS C-terminal target domain-containing protein [Rhodohalobacter sp. SW132]